MNFTPEQYAQIFGALSTGNEQFIRGLAKAAIKQVVEITEDMHGDLLDRDATVPTMKELIDRSKVYVRDLDQENDTVMVQIAEAVGNLSVQMTPQRSLKMNVTFLDSE